MIGFRIPSLGRLSEAGGDGRQVMAEGLHHATETGVASISCGIGTQMVVKRTGFSSVMRFADSGDLRWLR